MNKHSKHAAAFNTILVFGVIFVILIAVSLTYILNVKSPVRFFFAALLMFSPTVVICYALYCHFDNQDTIITNQEKLIEKMDAISIVQPKADESAKATKTAPTYSAAPAAANKPKTNVHSKTPINNTTHKWTCPKCGASNSMTDISCPECGAYR